MKIKITLNFIIKGILTQQRLRSLNKTRSNQCTMKQLESALSVEEQS